MADLDDPSVYLLWALYPCPLWRITHQGGSSECDCEEFLEGIFVSPMAAKRYIPEYLDEHHKDLEWEIEDNEPQCGYYHEYAKPTAVLVYEIRRMSVYSW